MAETFHRRVIVTVNDGDFDAHRASMQTYTGKTPGRMRRVGRAIKRWIGTVAVAAFAALAAAMGRSVQQAAKFEQGIAEVSTLLDSDEAQMTEFREGLLEIRKNLPVATDLTTELYDAISAGVDADDALEFVRTAARAGIADRTADTGQAVDILTTAINAFNLEASQANEVSDSFFTAIRLGKTTLGELSDQFGTVAPIASSLGISIGEVNAALATLTANGLSTDKATTALRGTMNALLNNTDEFADAGIRVNRVIGERGLQGILQEVAERADGSTQAIREFFPDVRGLTAALSLATTASEEFDEALQVMSTNAGATQTALQKMRDTVQNAWQITKNRLEVLLIRIGDKILPTVNRGLDRLNGWLAGLEDNIPDLVPFAETLRDIVINLKELIRLTRDFTALFGGPGVKENIEAFRQEVDLANASIALLGETTAWFFRELAKGVTDLGIADMSNQVDRLNERMERFQELRRRSMRRMDVDRGTEGRDPGAPRRGPGDQMGLLPPGIESRIPDFSDGGEGEDGSEGIEKAAEVTEELVANVENIDGAPLEELQTGLAGSTSALLKLVRQFEQGKIDGIEFAFLVRRALGEMNAETLKTIRAWVKQADVAEETKREMLDALNAEIKKQEEASDKQSERNRKLENWGNTLQDVARSIRALTRVANAFGEIDEEVQEVIQSTADMVDNVGRVLELESDLEGGIFGSAGNVARAAPALVGAGAGLVSTLVNVFEATTTTLKEQRNEMERLRRSLENTRESLDRLFEQAQIGQDLTREQVEQAAEQVDALENFRPAEFDALGRLLRQSSLSQEEVITILEDLQETTGIDNLVPTFEALLEAEGGDLSTAISRLLEETDLPATTDQLVEEFGQFGRSIEGIVREARLRRQIGQGAQAIFDAIREDFEDAGLSDALIGVITSAFEEGRNVPQLLRQILLGQGPIALEDTGLSAEALERLIGVFEDLEGTAQGQGQGFTSSTQIARTITEIQANQLLAFQDEQVRLQREMVNLLRQGGGGTSADATAVINVQSAPIDRMMEEIEEELRSSPELYGQ